MKKLYISNRLMKMLLMLLLFLASSKTEQLFASHTVGSDITYSCTGTPGIYQINIKIYRDCQGIELCPNCPTSLSPSCSQSVNITGAAGSCLGTSFGSGSLSVLNSVSGYDVVQLCALQKTVCSNCGTRTPGSFTPGIEVYQFQGTVNLSALPANCCMVDVGWSTCCRNAAITTLVNPSSLSFYTGCTINRCVTPCNSAPVFTNDPVAIACAGQDFTYNLGAIDPDGDSLSYAFGQSYTGPGSVVPYASPYSATVPFPYLGAPGQSPPLLPPAGINIDPVTGDLRFRPLGNFVSNLVVEVTQWKLVNGVYTKVGITRRDIQFYSIICAANNPPVIRTRDGNGVVTTPAQPQLNWGICAGQQLCIYIMGWDNTAGWDTTDLIWNNPPNLVANGATFVPAYNVSARQTLGPMQDSFKFCWTPPPSMASNLPYYFNVTAKDRACPIPARANRTFAITVQKVPIAIINKIDKNCGFYDFTYTIQNNPVNLDVSYTQFQVENSPQSNSYVTFNANSVTGFHFLQPGWYRIKLRLSTLPPPNPSGCPNNNIIDSVYVPQQIKTSIRDTFNCLGTPVTQQAFSYGGTPLGSAYSYTLYNGLMTSTTVIGVPSLDSNFTLNPPTANVTSNYKIVVKDLNNCKDSAAFHIFTRPLPLKELTPSMRLCPGTTDTLDAGNSGGSVGVWRWRKSPVSPVMSDSVSQKILPRDSGQYIVRKVDNFGCARNDTAMVYFNNVVPVSAGPDRTLCFNDPQIKIRAFGTTAAIDSFQWRQLPITGSTTILSNKDTLMVSPPTTTDYQVRGFITYGGVTCSNVDTVNVKVFALPIYNSPTKTPLCRNTSIISLPQITSTNKTLVSKVWSYSLNPSAVIGNQLKIDSLKNLPPPTGSQPFGNVIKLTLTDNDGCVVRDSLIVAVFPVPVINAGPKYHRCDISGVFNIRPGSQGYSPNGGVLGFNELWQGRGVYKPVPSQNLYSFDPKDTAVKLLPDTNILSYTFTTNFPPVNTVSFSPAVGGITIASPTGGCQATDTVIFEVIKSPIVKAGTGSPLCKSSDTVNLDKWMLGTTTTATNPLTSYWYLASPDNVYSAALTGGRYFLAKHPAIPNATKQYALVYADTATTCIVSSATTLQVNENPVVQIDYLNPLDSAVCRTKGSVTFYMNPANASSGDAQMFSSPALDPDAFDVTAGKFNLNSAKVTNQLYNVKYYFVDPGTKCTNQDSINIRVQEAPKIALTDASTVCAYNASFSLGFKTQPVWPYDIKNVNWSTPDGTAGDAGIVKTATGITYNATAADISRGTITFKAITLDSGVCNAATDQKTFTILPKPKSVFSIAPDRGCVDDRYGITLNPVYTAGPTGVASPNYYWFMDNMTVGGQLNKTPASDNTFTQTFSQPGTHKIYLLVDASSCLDTSSASIYAYATPHADFTTDPTSTTVAKPWFNFFNKSTITDASNLTYTWYMGPGIVNGPDRILYDANPSHVNFIADTARTPIRLVVTSQYGCIDSIVKFIRIDPDITVFIPSAFYPNSSLDCYLDCNRSFKVAATGFESIEIFVFNRWGQLVFKTTNVNEGWTGIDQTNGKVCEQDAYIYQVNATSFSGKKYTYSGSITLLR